MLDFTKFGQVDDGNVHCFVVALLSRGNEAAKSAEWKPRIQYYDYLAQSTEKKPVKQVFPYVKAAFLDMHDSGKLDGFTRRIIASDGGPGHFKVYKTQFFMSKWCSELFTKMKSLY